MPAQVMSAVQIFTRTGTGWSIDPLNPTVDSTGIVFDLRTAGDFQLNYAYTKGTSGESGIVFGFDVQHAAAASWRKLQDDTLAQRDWMLSATASGSFWLGEFGRRFTGYAMRAWSYTVGTSVATTSLTLHLIPIAE